MMKVADTKATTDLSARLRQVISSRGGLPISLEEIRAQLPESDGDTLQLILEEWEQMNLLERGATGLYASTDKWTMRDLQDPLLA